MRRPVFGPVAGETDVVLVLESRDELRRHLDEIRGAGRSVGLVPTMGALHEGHLSLVTAAAAQCDEVVLTIFVNPLQFAAGEDLSSYPRPIERDLAMADEAGVDVVFTPSVDEMYPQGASTTVHVAGLTERWEGAARPTHFDGVTTIVAKLFALTGPCRAYFGEKDFQQLAVVSRMATDLEMPVVVVGCPIVREPDGLAMSSRNVHLAPEHRSAARVLSSALRAGAALVGSARAVRSDGGRRHGRRRGCGAPGPARLRRRGGPVDPRAGRSAGAGDDGAAARRGPIRHHSSAR